MALSADSKHRGYAVITYHDIRAARLAMHTVHGTFWRGRQLNCTVVGQQDLGKGSPACLALISLDGGKSLDDAYYLLSAFGELRDLRRDSLRPNCCFAEFFDSRHASTAYATLASSPELRERLIILDSTASGDILNDNFGLQGPSVDGQVVGYGKADVAHQYHRYQSNVSDITRNLSEMSLESGYGGHQAFSSAHALGGQGLSSSDLVSRGTHTQVGNHGYSTGNMWPVNSVNSLGSSPPAGMPWVNSQEVLAALQVQQQRALVHQGNIMQVALQQALMGHDASYINSTNVDVIGGISRRHHSESSLGGRLARRQMNPMAEAERKAQQDRLYGLDLNKILSGEDKRTTLMIKNIPNKYTQKMLLAVCECICSVSHLFFSNLT